MSDKLQVAETIREQNGQGAFAMLGAHSFVGDENSLSFRVRGSRKVNLIIVMLDEGRDTYSVEGWKMRTFDGTLISQAHDIQSAQLHDTLAAMTGLAVRL